MNASLSATAAAASLGISVEELRAAERRGEILGHSVGGGRGPIGDRRYTPHALACYRRWRASGAR